MPEDSPRSLRRLRNRTRCCALATIAWLLLAALPVVAAEASGSTALSVGAHVVASARLRQDLHPAAIEVTAADVARGSVAVSGQVVTTIVTNSPEGYVLRADLADGPFRMAERRESGGSATIVAGGTSLPEVATSVAASLRGQRDIAVGNVVGSNIFNVLLVVGSTAALAPGGIPVVPAAMTFDLPVMVAVSIACMPVFFAGMRITRLEGAIFIGYYAAYIVFLILG